MDRGFPDGKALLLFMNEAEAEPPATLFALLAPGQQERAARFRKPLRRSQHVWSRLLVLVLARRLARALGAESFSIEERPPESPAIRVGERVFFTSVSHSASRVACLAAPAPCAIDIERFDGSRDFRRYAQTAFSKETAASLALEADAASSFYRAWGAYECAVKLGIPRDFVWDEEAHAPKVRGLRVETRIGDGWSRVTALPPGMASPLEETLSPETIEKALL